MGLNHPSLAHRVLDLERDRLLARGAADRRAEGLGPDPAFRPSAAAARRLLGVAIVGLGLRLRPAPPVEVEGAPALGG